MESGRVQALRGAAILGTSVSLHGRCHLLAQESLPMAVVAGKLLPLDTQPGGSFNRLEL